MSLKDLICNGEEIYKTTRELQRKKIKAALSKNQLIFLQKLLIHDVTPKLLRIKLPIKTQKATLLTKESQKNLLVLAKNDATQRLRNYNIEVNHLSQEFDAHFATIERITDISKEQEYVKKRNHLIEKYQNLTKGNKIQKMTGNKTLLKPAVLNLTNQLDLSTSSGTSKPWT